MLDIVTDIEHTFTDGNLSSAKLPKVSLYAIGGFPITIRNEIPYLIDKFISRESIVVEINKALGLSGMLTYSNKSNFSLGEMGNKCKELEHFWGYNFITLSFLFANVDPIVELSFLRNNTFFQSWIVGNNTIYGMTGSIKDFKKFISNKDDKSFDLATREIMAFIDNTYNFMWK
jgi:hypothetical protein